MENFKDTKRSTLYVLLAVGIFFFGIFIGYNQRPAIEKVTTLINKEPAIIVGEKTDFASFWKAWNVINEKYPNADSVSDQDRVYGAISGLVGSLNDPYSVFFKPEEAKSFEADISGFFGGIGVEVGMKDRVLTVIAPLKGSPGERAGIKSSDKILKINGTSTSDMSIDKAISLIRGKEGTQVTLTIFRDGEKESRDIKVTRETINIPTLDTETRSDGIFVIKLYSFSANSIDLFRGAIKRFAESGYEKLVLDLRGNPGGYLDAAVDMASWFLPQGKPVVIEDYGTGVEQKVYRSTGYDVFNDKLKFVILIDGGSASASEILAGAMKDYKLARLVGTQSYCKGSVQEVVDITSDTILKITVAKWMTPNGTSISATGLTPDYKVEFTQKDFDAKRDPQMNKAVELLNNWTPIK